MPTCDGTNPGGQKPNDRLEWDWVIILVFVGLLVILAGVGALEAPVR